MPRRVINPNVLKLPKQLASEKKQSICKLCDIRDWANPNFAQLSAEIFTGENGTKGQSLEHRKLWEFTKLIESLKAGKVFDENSIGLSVAAGMERVLFYLANKVGRIVATDIYGEGNFSDREAVLDGLINPKQFACYPYKEENLKVRYMDALDLKFPDNTFDFAFSLSSIEHFGGIKNALNSLQEMCRVVRPGGLVVVTTECAINGFKTDQVFSPKELLSFAKSTKMKLLEEINWSLSAESLNYLIDMRKDDLNTIPHINLTAFGSIFTSICLAFIKESPSNLRANEAHIMSKERIANFDHMLEALPIEKPKMNVKKGLLSTKYQSAKGLLKSTKLRAQELYVNSRGV